MTISQRLRTCAKHTGLDAVIELLNEAADEIDRLSAGQQAEAQQPATPEPLTDHSDHVAEIAARLRLVAKLAGCPDAVPDEDGRAVGCIFSVLGNMRRALEKKLATGEPVAWMASYVDPVGNDHVYVTSHRELAVENDMHGDPKPLYTRPAPSVPADVVRVPLQVLKDASEALGNFVSDHGWGDADMQAMDNLDAYIARHEANRAAMLAAK